MAFSPVFRVSRVCRLWREVAISPALWQHVDLASFWVKDRAKNDLKFRWLCENRLALVHDLNIGEWNFRFSAVAALERHMYNHFLNTI